MKLVLVTQRAPMYLPAFLDDLITRLVGAGHEVEGLVALSPTFKNSLLQEVRARLAYYGPVDFVRMVGHIAKNLALARLPVAGCYSVRNVLKKHDLEPLEIDSVNGAALRNFIKDRGVDVVLSIASSQIFRRRLLQAPPGGCLNYHMGLLPKYRGRQPLFWAMLHGEREVGLTVHEMDSELDSGPILAQTTLPVTPEDSLHDLYLKCISRGPSLVLEAVERLAAGESTRLPNDAEQATSFSFPTSSDVEAFRSRGNSFF